MELSTLGSLCFVIDGGFLFLKGVGRFILPIEVTMPLPMVGGFAEFPIDVERII